MGSDSRWNPHNPNIRDRPTGRSRFFICSQKGGAHIRGAAVRAWFARIADINSSTREIEMFKKMLKKFMRREEGSVFAEYALLLALIAIVTIAALSAVGSRIVDLFVAIELAISGV